MNILSNISLTNAYMLSLMPTTECRLEIFNEPAGSPSPRAGNSGDGSRLILKLNEIADSLCATSVVCVVNKLHRSV